MMTDVATTVPARAGARRLPMVAALLSLAVFGAVGYGVDQWTRGQLITQARGQADLRLMPYARVVSVAILRRVERLSALKSFVDTVRSRQQLDAEFPAYAAGLMRGATGVRALELLRGGVIERVYPLEGNEQVLGLNTMADPNSEPAREVRRAMASGEITMSVPRRIVQGPNAVVARQRLNSRIPGFPDLAAVVIETDSLLAIAGLLGGVEKLDVIVRDKTGAVIWPVGAAPLTEVVQEPIAAPDGIWTLEGAPTGGWNAAVSDTLVAMRVVWFVIATLIAGVAFLVTDRQSRLTASVRERTLELERTNLDLRREVRDRELAEAALRRHEEQMLQSQKMEAVGTLAGGIAHDFNNVLTAIIGFSRLADSRAEELMRSSAEGLALQGVRDDVQEVLRAAEHAAVITNQLLAFSRKQAEPPGALAVDAVMREFEPLLRRLLGERVRLVTRFPAGLPSVFADKGQLTQVLVNLAVNARDAMPAGGDLTIAANERAVTASGDGAVEGLSAGEYVEITVADTGTGMPPDVRARAFEPFFTTKGLGKGTGLGLATVYAIVTRAGGTVLLESESGRGTTFRVLLAVTATGHSAPAAEPSAERSGGHTETILVAEDEPSVRHIVTRVLSRRGYTVLVAESGEAALALIEGGAQLDLLLTDIVMPGMSGIALAQRVRPLRPGLRILFMSGYSEESRRLADFEEGEAMLLPKPFTPDELVRQVRAALDPG